MTSSPRQANLRWAFARALRVSYSQLGDAQSVNKAILVERDVSRIHLFTTVGRLMTNITGANIEAMNVSKMFLRWASFSSLELVWGNGESPAKLLRSMFSILYYGSNRRALLQKRSAAK